MHIKTLLTTRASPRRESLAFEEERMKKGLNPQTYQDVFLVFRDDKLKLATKDDLGRILTIIGARETPCPNEQAQMARMSEIVRSIITLEHAKELEAKSAFSTKLALWIAGIAAFSTLVSASISLLQAYKQ